MANTKNDSAASTEEKAEQFMQKQAEMTAEAVGEKISESNKALADVFKQGFEGLAKTLTGAETKSDEEELGEAEEVEQPKETEEEIEKRINAAIEKKFSVMEREERKAKGGDGVDAWEVLKKGITDNDDPVAVRVKNAVERFTDVKTTATYRHKRFKDLYQKPIAYNGKQMNESTPRTLAMVHAWMKFKTYPEKLTEHDKDIVQYILHNEKFSAIDDNRTDSRKLTDFERQQIWNGGMPSVHKERGEIVKDWRKALIDDSSSGGENAIPEFFDETVIILPVLGGEIAPLVDMMDVPRGTAAQGFQMGNPTLAAANTEGSAVNLFTTTSFIANHDTTFFRAAGFIELGRNFLEDAVPQMGQEILNAYLRVHGTWLDEQIAAGDGTTEPQGITVASGTTDITPANPSTNTLTIGDVIELLFGVAKAFRQMAPGSRAAFGMTDSTYERIRSIATGVTGDTRLVFGMGIEDYMLFGHPVVIEENGLTNSDIFFSQLWGYKLYRRQGPRPIRAEGGDTLTRENTVLLGLDCRYGGQLKRGGYASVIDSASA